MPSVASAPISAYDTGTARAARAARESLLALHSGTGALLKESPKDFFEFMMQASNMKAQGDVVGVRGVVDNMVVGARLQKRICEVVIGDLKPPAAPAGEPAQIAKCRAQAAANPKYRAWLNPMPGAIHGDCFNDLEFRDMFSHLRAPLPSRSLPPGPCGGCNETTDNWGLHCRHCSKKGYVNFHPCHNAIRDLLAELCEFAGVGCAIEVLPFANGKRVDVYMYNFYDDGSDLSLDVYAFGSDRLDLAQARALNAAKDGVKYKRYLADCARAGIHFKPIGFGSGGLWGPALKGVIDRLNVLSKDSWATSGKMSNSCPSLKAYAYQRLSAAAAAGFTSEASVSASKDLLSRSTGGLKKFVKPTTKAFLDRASVQNRHHMADRCRSLYNVNGGN